ncbi:uncharacterized protein [Haliotis cracherodii]|uniref:uncharacterized protein n=1 Tax=Haliotis cracherodii TaxID=6455 RepID=UPI0039EBB9A9
MNANNILAFAIFILNSELAFGVDECFINGEWKTYKRSQQTCCGGVLERYTQGKKCCKETGRVYYENHGLCCEDKMYERYDENGVEYGCCGNTKIPMERTVCCGGVSHPRHPDMGCCGKQYINLTSQMCCQNEDNPALVSKHVRGADFTCCGHLVVDLSNQNCRWNISGNTRNPIAVNRLGEICDGKIISLREKSCCDDTIYDQPYLDPEDMSQRNPTVECCGTVGYNNQRQVCCSQYPGAEVVIPAEDHLQCCVGSETGYYNTTTELCCAGSTWTRYSSNDTCCGTHRIDGHSQGCCAGHPYKKDTHFCCDGSPSEVLKLESTCCGGARLAPSKMCCQNTQVETKEGHDACCLSYYSRQFATYNSSEKECVEGEVQTIMKLDDRYCGHVPYSDNKAVCCNGKVHNFPRGDTLGCCRRWDLKQTVYSETTQMCCQGHVHNESPNDAECCGAKSYPKHSDRNPCHEKCGGSYYNADVTVCCGNKQFLMEEHGDDCCGNSPYFSMVSYCCGKELYNPKNESCCGGYAVVSRRGRRRQRCCKNTMVYFRKDGRCKSNGIVERKKDIHPMENLCRRKTWKNLNGIEVKECFQTFAIQCTIKHFLKEKEELSIMMKCRNLKRRYLREKYHDSFLTPGKNQLTVRMMQSTKKKVRCNRRRLKNRRVIIFLDKEPIRKRSHFDLRISEKDTFRVVADTKHIRDHLDGTSSQKYCQELSKIFSNEHDEDLYQ